MPLYEYKCASCGSQFEKLVRMSESDAQIECPKCGSVETKRQVSLFGWSGGSGGGLSNCVPAPSGGG